MRQPHEWEARYLEGSIGWDRGGVNPALNHWLDCGEMACGSIVLPGCGRGFEVVQLARLGFAVTALDFAPSAVQFVETALAANHLMAEVVAADVLLWQPAAPVDAVYEQTCLCALPPESWVAYATQLHQWLRPGGSLFALFMQTGDEGGPPFHCDLLAMRRLFPDARWQWPSDGPLLSHHRSGRFELGYRLIRR